MQSLSLKLVPGLNNLRSSAWPSQRERGRRIMAVSSSDHSSPSERDGAGAGDDGIVGREGDKAAASFLSRSQTYSLLKQQMAVAAKFEDYKEAARIRDSLKSFEEEEPVLRLRRLMRKAIDEERFEGIRVQVRSVYIEGRSQPSKGQYFFAYRIRITNTSQRPVQLLRRHWIITDANGKTENIWGVGVIGEQPVILPKTGFEYSSACPLSTPSGRMEGDFEMKHVDRVGSSTFNVAIAPFSLSIIGDDTDEPL
ncbi:protein ApaG-like isoform X2 [Phoenix dactylifera]|uniref:Protein ApaG-like isoform X2 n=1 Tax=Phoenix dactylifera TaxID=42345 RepID=A0A8B7D5C8_PHODC|nr:protein ApaG-like isoform X2 [Phoenix dactylifera]XP_038976379.1 protein ApaG-like isoform X2 [Phoenix dactylifera]